MHADDVRLTTALATRLVDTQMPRFAGRPVRPLSALGTDNWLFRLGPSHVLRFPRRASAVRLLERELACLPRFPGLPLAIPRPVATGDAGEGYPWPWAVYDWIEGTQATPASLRDPQEVAGELAGFLRAFQALPGLDGPIAGSTNHLRGVPLERLDDRVCAAISGLSDLYDAADLRDRWDAARDSPPWDKAPVWIHGDLQPGNLLLRDGRLAAVIDFGLMARGDPAVDLIPAWALFDAAGRAAFLDAMSPDPATIRRGRGWALYAGLVALDYYRHSHVPLARASRRTIEQVLGDTAG
ncbi:Predicted kinase, aminoglycoside phosphotransferase (APT) family [Cribrihabitans marinus]|uniref:Predicted kinase, aminoglycoside phosphotransferase (APT) family n=1 Tax=Cribrihabitans marinus TaxID=1227549 RepID=A0A1H6Y468_9RHOB|nr:acetyltransferase [Cribrihabitans marinus]SEJ35236.1 Predicted kinase, aminoglycoside phosphotransferase (APT) family [Cribrihabitans marinus]